MVQIAYSTCAVRDHDYIAGALMSVHYDYWMEATDYKKTVYVLTESQY